MSYTIVYKKQFLRINSNYTSDGVTRYLPLILCGSNNVVETATGKRSRDWSMLFSQIKNPVTESELLNCIKNIPDDAECFVYNNKWVYGKDMKGFVTYGIRNAKTIEELTASALGLSLLLYYTASNATGYGFSTHDQTFVKTTPKLMQWIDSHKTENIHIQYSPKEFKLLTKPTTNPVVLKGADNRYVYDYGRNDQGEIWRIALGEIEKAKVFDSYEEAKELADTFRDLRIVQYKNVTRNKPWRILVDSNVFVKKLSSRHLWFTAEEKEARKFANEKEAETYINEKLVPRFNRNFKAINIQTDTTGV